MTAIVNGLHHVTSMCSDAQGYDTFWRALPGIRRVKKTVNFDNPSLYHLYYGDYDGRPGSLLTYFPNTRWKTRKPGAGETAVTYFRVAESHLEAWRSKVNAGHQSLFGAEVLTFDAPDGDRFYLLPEPGDDTDILGLAGVQMQVQDAAPTAELLELLGYKIEGRDGNILRLTAKSGNGADIVDLLETPDADSHSQGAGSVHHVAFSARDMSVQAQLSDTLRTLGYEVTDPRDRDYFQAIYFRSPGGILFEIATEEPGFAVDEPAETLGEALRLPKRHSHLRSELEISLPPLS